MPILNWLRSLEMNQPNPPELALKFDEFPEAFEMSRKCNKSIVVGMFDIGTQIFVAQCGAK